MRRTALVLGAGMGGICAAQTLRNLLPRDDRAVLVDRAEPHVYQASLPWVLVGRRDMARIRRPLERAARSGIEFIRGEVTGISPGDRHATVEGRALSADALIIALGAAYDAAAIPGLADCGHCICTPDGAPAGRRALETFRGGRIAFVTASPQYKCPAAPYEFALLVDGELRRRGPRAATQLDFHAAEPGPMLTAGTEVSGALRQLIASRDIAYHPGRQIARVDAGGKRLHIADGARAEFDLLFYVPVHRVPVVIRAAGLTDESGWIAVDRHTLATRFDGVYAIGDTVTIPLKMGRPLPKAGVSARAQAQIVAHNVAVAWTGRGAPTRFDGVGACFIETGDGRAGMGQGDSYTEPLPAVKLRAPSRLWHAAKVLYEK